ncbi:AMP-binding protein [Candidatus Omnitrophota bacterium]
MSSTFLLHERLTEVCNSFADTMAFMEMQTGQKYTYSQILSSVQHIGTWLVTSGVKPQDKVAIILDNCVRWPVIYFGSMFAGATVVPMDVKLSDLEVYNLLTDSETKVVFTSSKFMPFFEKSLPNLPNIKRIVLVDKKSSRSPFVPFDHVIEKRAAVAFPKVSLEDTASIIYTSGTTDKPKGVVLSHKNFSSNYTSLERLKFCSKTDCFISILPLHHVFAFTATLLFPLFMGARIVYPKSLKSEDLMDCLRKASVTVFMGVPELYTLFHKGIFNKMKSQSVLKQIFVKVLTTVLWPLRRITGINLAKPLLKPLHKQFGSSFRYFVSGGAKLNPRVAKDFFKLGFTILEGYGLTETSPVVSFNLPKKYKIGSVGRSIDGVSVKIGDKGEILIAGDNIMGGYYKNQEQTDKVIKDNWFYSGDSGCIDKDGFIFITGRIKEMIVLSSGKNIYPEEIENYFKKSNFIKEICILSVKNAEGNDVLASVVVPDFEYFKQIKDANVNRKIKWELENFSSKLPSYKRINDFIIASEELPKTRLGKLKRYEVKAKYQNKFIDKQQSTEDTQSATAEDANILDTEIGKKVIAFFLKELSVEKEIKLDDHLEIDLGLDSLARVELGLGLENVFDIEIPESVIDEVFTVRELITKLNELVISEGVRGKKDKQAFSWSSTLDIPPPEEQVAKIGLHPNPFDKLLSFIFPKLLFVVFKIFFLLKVKGRTNLPTEGIYVLCPNHASYLDGLLIACAAPFKTVINLYFLGDKNIFEHPLLRWGLKMARMVPIDPTKEMMHTLQISSYILRHNKMLCIFPEGLRSFEGKPTEFKKGVGILAKELKVASSGEHKASEKIKIIPVAIIGSFQAWPRTRRFPRPFPITIVFGEPLEPEQLLSEGKASGITDDYQAIASAIERHVESLFYNH